VAIRVTKNRQSNHIYIGHNVNQKDWDEKEENGQKIVPNSDYLNNLLTSKLSETSKVLPELQTNNADITSNQTKDEIP